MSAEEISVYFGIFAVLAAGAWALYRHFSEKPGGGVEVDVNAIVVRLEEAARREGSLTAQLDESLQREEGLGKQLREAVQAVADQRDSPDAPPGIDDALSLLAEGRTGAAEAVLREVKERRKAEGAEALKEAAAAVRHIGALAFLHDTEKALAAYREAVDLDPDDPDGWKFLGNLLNPTGDIDGAIKACNHVLALGNRVDAQVVIADATSNLASSIRPLATSTAPRRCTRRAWRSTRSWGGRRAWRNSTATSATSIRPVATSTAPRRCTGRAWRYFAKWAWLPRSNKWKNGSRTCGAPIDPSASSPIRMPGNRPHPDRVKRLAPRDSNADQCLLIVYHHRGTEEDEKERHDYSLPIRLTHTPTRDRLCAHNG